MKASLLTASTPNASQLDDLAQESGAVDAEQQRLYQLQLQRQHDEFEQGMLLEREQRVRQIEADVLNVNEIMRDLSVLMNEQGEHIGKLPPKIIKKKKSYTNVTAFYPADTIESRVDYAAGNVEDGTSELMKAAQSQAKYRKKVLILLVIAVIIGLIVTGIIVSQLKS